MILIVLAALCIISVPLTGGNLGRLSELRLRWLWTAPAALILQTVIVTVAPGGSEGLHAAAHIPSYVLVGAFLWANRHIAGAKLIALGALSNTLAIVANDGVMPASERPSIWPASPRAAAFRIRPRSHIRSCCGSGDIIPVPVRCPM